MYKSRLWCKTLWQPFNKAKDTFISALANKRGWFFAEKYAKVFVYCLCDRYFMLVLLSIKADHKFFLGDIKPIIDKVANRVTVDRTKQVTWLQASAVRRAFGHYLTHPSIHFRHSFYFLKVEWRDRFGPVISPDADKCPRDYNRSQENRQMIEAIHQE